MKKLLPSILTVLFFTLASSSQTPVPTAAPTPTDDGEVVKITTNLVQIDVTVTNKKGEIIRDLKPEEVEIYENGKKQDITNFSFIAAPKIIQELVPGAQKQTVPLPPTAVRPEQVRRTIALVVDDLTLSFEDTYHVKRTLKKFVNEQMQEGDLVAIIRTAGGSGALQQFTTDRRLLYAAIEKLRWQPLRNSSIGSFEPIEATILERAQNTGSTEIKDAQVEDDRAFRRESEDARREAFSIGTLGTVSYIVRGMRELPGRKSVLLISQGFKFTSKFGNGTSGFNNLNDSLLRLIDSANRASVVVNTMDARRLETTGLTAADSGSGLTGPQLLGYVKARETHLSDTQDGLRYLADQTGGRAIVNANDLSGGIRRILDDQSYYLIGYQPDDETFDEKNRRYNKIEVKVTRSGANVRTRSGFFGVSNEQVKNTEAALTVGQQIRKALFSPFSVNDIALRLNTVYENDAARGAFITSLLHVDAKALKFTDEPNGEKKAVLNIVAVSFGDSGAPADQLSKTYSFSLKPEIYTEVLRDGFVYNFTFPVKKPGSYQFRVALRDEQGERVGSASQYIEVPDLTKKRLTLSGIILDNMPFAEWQNYSTNSANGGSNYQMNFMNATSSRRFKRGTVLVFGANIYNGRLNAARKSDLTAQIRVLRDGKIVHGDDASPVAASVQMAAGSAQPKAQTIGAFALGAEMEPGEYVLQIIVTDNLAKEKQKIATQFIEFELVGQ